MYIYIRICIYIIYIYIYSIYLYVYTQTHTHIYAHTTAFTKTHIHKRTSASTNTHMYTRTRTHILQKHARIHTHAQTTQLYTCCIKLTLDLTRSDARHSACRCIRRMSQPQSRVTTNHSRTQYRVRPIPCVVGHLPHICQ